MINVAIVEDNFIALNVLKKMLQINFPDIQVIWQALNIKEGIKLLKAEKPDLLFLDIELPDGNAFDILSSIDKQDFNVVFVTSHENYAIKAIKFSAFDYILKPVTKNDLEELLERYNIYEKKYNFDLKYKIFNENLISKKQKIVLSTNKESVVVEPDEIIRCQSDSFYTNVFLNNGKNIMLTKTLKEFEQMLSQFGFIRVHNSHLVNIKQIKSFDKSSGKYITLQNNTKIMVSRRRQKFLLDALRDNKFIKL